MGEETLGHVVVSFNHGVNVSTMHAHSHTHVHVLWSFRSFVVQLEQVGSFESLEAKEGEREVTIIDDGRVEFLLVGHDHTVCFMGEQRGRTSGFWVHVFVHVRHHLGEELLGLFVQVGDSNPGSQDGVVWMLGGERGGSLSGERIELPGRDTGVHTGDDFLRDQNLQKGGCARVCG